MPATMVLLILIRTFGDEVRDSTTILAMPHFRVTTLPWRGLELGPLELVLVGIPKSIGGESQMLIESILGILRRPIISFTYFFLLVNHLGLESKIMSSFLSKDTSSSLFPLFFKMVKAVNSQRTSFEVILPKSGLERMILDQMGSLGLMEVINIRLI
jgi:hypothetical protein